MEAVIKGLVVLIANLNLKFLSLEIFNSEGRSLEFSLEKLKREHTVESRTGAVALGFRWLLASL